MGDAYCEISGFFETYSVSAATAPRAHYSAHDLAFVKPYLAPAAKRYWDKTVAAAVAGDKNATGHINALTYFDLAELRDRGFTFPQPGGTYPLTTLNDAGRAIATVDRLDDGRPLLDLKFPVRTNVIVLKAGKPYVIKVTKRVYVSLLPSGRRNSNHDWLLYSWNNDWNSTKASPFTN